jgi:hypothetical protein
MTISLTLLSSCRDKSFDDIVSYSMNSGAFFPKFTISELAGDIMVCFKKKLADFREVKYYQYIGKISFQPPPL